MVVCVALSSACVEASKHRRVPWQTWPNDGGADFPCRQLYVGVLRSMALTKTRTVSWTVATLLASDPPWELQAEVLARVQSYRASEHSRGMQPAWEDIARITRRAEEALIRRLRQDLGSLAAGLATLEAVRPRLERWARRGFGVLTFRLAQVLTGHGCFGKYLHQIARRELSPVCNECDASADSAPHTLAECHARSPQRHALMAVVGRDHSRPSVVGGL